MPIYQEFEFESKYDTAYGIIKIPENTVFYRGHSTKYGSVTDRPAYYSSKGIAELYAKSPGYVVSPFTNTTELRLLDIRFMINILRDMFYANPPHLSSLAVILSFGLCSLRHQVELMNMRYSSPESRNNGHKALQKILDEHDPASLYELQGVRVGETINDAETMSFLGTLLNGFVDGFIAPQIDSPYHVPNNHILPEMIIFNPWRSGITIIREEDLPRHLPTISMHTIYFTYQLKDKYILNYRSTYSDFYEPPIYKSQFYIASGGGDDKDDTPKIPIIEQINERWEDEEIQQALLKGVKDAEKWKYKVHFGFYHPPAPTVPVSPWTTVSSDSPKKESIDSKKIQMDYSPKPTVPVSPWIVNPNKNTRKTRRKPRKIDRF
jgi:hypothetical protein